MSAGGSIEVVEDKEMDGRSTVFVSHVHVAGKQNFRETFRLTQLEAAMLLEQLTPLVASFGEAPR